MPANHREKYAEVILPLSLKINYTYSIPQELEDDAIPGKRVIVQFGKKKYYTAIIYRIGKQAPEGYKAKPIESLLDPGPLISEQQFRLWEWIKQYYLCNLGDVMNAAVPAGLKLESETVIILHPFHKEDPFELSDDEYLVKEALTRQKELKIADIRELLNKKTVDKTLKSLLEKNIIFLKEELKSGYKSKTEGFIKISPAFIPSETHEQLFSELNRAPKQKAFVLNYFELVSNNPEISKSELLKATGKNYQALNKLIEKGIFTETEKQVSRLETSGILKSKEIELTPAQKEAFNKIKDYFKEKNTVLLHGVTSSGKTEIYAELIKEYISDGKQVLYLLPEIALTAQMISRLKKIFGDHVGIYHSRFNSMERVEIWNKVRKKEYQLVLGARSALFLPFNNLGLIVVDEEHDSSYKQFDPAPRYLARDSAIMLGEIYSAKVLLGSATPAIESYYNALNGKYGLVQLTKRFGNIALPEIRFVDLKQSERVGSNSYLSETLITEIKETLEKGEQVILFRNRRGYSPMLMCGTCGHIPQCKNCDVSLTYHKFNDQLKCHYCGYSIPTVTTCPSCSAHNMRVMGFGTEKVEDEINLVFDKAVVKRMDYDSVKGKKGHQKLISDFEEMKIDILVGTQMVSKGLDFEKVSLVGIINADQLLKFPDFRSNERAFQLMLQVAGRAGRKHRQGRVFIQARDLGHPVFSYVLNNDYQGFFESELDERREFRYPPFVRIIRIHFKHRDKQTVISAAWKSFHQLKKDLGQRVYEPIQPLIGRIRNQYLMEIMLKLERSKKVADLARNSIAQSSDILKGDPKLRSVTYYADVDPY